METTTDGTITAATDPTSGATLHIPAEIINELGAEGAKEGEEITYHVVAEGTDEELVAVEEVTESAEILS